MPVGLAEDESHPCAYALLPLEQELVVRPIEDISGIVRTEEHRSIAGLRSCCFVLFVK